MRERIQEVIDRLRPALQADGGDLELVALDEAFGTVEIRLTGIGSGCPCSSETLRNGIENEIIQSVPGIREVKTLV